MTNVYYNNDSNIQPNTNARAQDVTAELNAIAVGFDKLPTENNLKRGKTVYAVDTGAANVYAIALSDVPASYEDGMDIAFKAANANTGASTINVNALGAISIKRFDGTDLLSGDIASGSMVECRYNGTNFVMMSQHGGETSISLLANSTTSLLIEVAVKNFEIEAGKAFQAGLSVDMVSSADITSFMRGSVTSYSGTTLTVNVTIVGGSGTFADWSIFETVGISSVEDDASPTLGGNLDANTNNVTNVGSFSAASATIDGAFSAASATIDSAFSAASATIDGAFTSATANISGALVAGTLAGDGTLITGIAVGLTLLSTVNASAASTVDIETTFDSTYDRYLIICDDFTVSSSNTGMRMRLKVAGSYRSGGTDYQHAGVGRTDGGAIQSTASTGSQFINMSSAAVGNTSTDGASFTIGVSHPTEATKRHIVTYSATGIGSTGQLIYGDGAATCIVAGALTGVRIFAASGTCSGTFYLYGVTKV